MESGMISVDKWSSGSQAYFLTHLHADHTAGLSSTWRRALLYCSRITAKLFSCKFPDFDLSLLRVLDIGRWYSLSLTAPSSGSATDVYVKAIDAQHCPGSVMYLFRGEFGCKLYTGDFRWEKNGNRVENARSMLLDALKNEKLDIMYLDNTYCNPTYTFPSREVAAKQVVDIITSHPNHDIIIGIDSLGKEDLLLYISRTLNIKIWVWPERLQIMHLLGFHKNFTTQTSLTRVRAVPRYSFSIETLEGLNMLRPTIGIMPSGLPWASPKKKDHSKDISGSAKSNHNEYIFVVPYSDHSCFSEIQEFIELLRPINIRGIVSSSSCHIDPCYYFDHLCGTKQAFWRIQRQHENEEVTNSVEADEQKESESEGISSTTAVGRKRRLDQVDFFGIRVSRVSLLRRLSRGVKIANTEYLSL
ncbi:5' exonuclease apollo [Phtheirospermum japonicum]|uniref:5' exonuclease Apollo n=1 Tax=Phtheirospermum japonicum TaxID=374723 RepID=A0A830BZS2_9LAMI|nr:5' exonuclease apollo [Phtheirospermum japonicum]